MIPLKQSRRQFLKSAGSLSIAGSAAPFALNLATIGAAAAQSVSDYKALVCLFLYGANDHNNTVIPFDAANFAAYQGARASIARAMTDLVPLTPSAPLVGSNAGRAFALPTELTPLKSIWDAGKLAILANVGPLIVPTTKAQYNAASVPLPPKLFSHNDQQSVWQASAPEGVLAGWGGRIGDLMAANNSAQIFTCNSVAGAAVFITGQTTIAYQLGTSGSTAITGLSGTLFGSTSAATTLRTLITDGGTNLFTQDLAATTQRSIDANVALSGALTAAPDLPLPSTLSNSNLGAQLRLVARMISQRNTLGAKRQVFFVSLGGFDTHDDQIPTQPNLHTQVGNAIKYFYDAINTLGIANSVTLFTASDFGRTLTSNGDGSDHGWGAHHFIMGGAVQGQRYYGTFPVMGLNNNDEVGSGRLLPTTSVDQFAATLARWFGVSESNLELVVPNIRNFSNTNLGFMG
ncbi:MAG TPA: DUF1501 domain-containing protein [Usitatibacteraceae bacterium]|nr:DUF1501 domain-containing protein [Usitatibacteraceae bacterium]